MKQLHPVLYETGPACEGCSYRRWSIGYTPPAGPADSRLLVVGEAPGRNELETGVPFSGRSGTRLNIDLDRVGIHRLECRITNVVKCRPVVWVKCILCAGRGTITYGAPRVGLVREACPACETHGMVPVLNKGGTDYLNTAPDVDQVKTCMERYLDQELEGFKGELILALGATAMKALTDADGSIGEWRGSVRTEKLGGREVKVFITYHPAFLLREAGPKMIPVVQRDFQRVADILSRRPDVVVDYQEDTSVLPIGQLVAMDLETHGGLDPRNGGGLVCCSISTKQGWSRLLTPEQMQVVLTQNTIIGHNFYMYDAWWLKWLGHHVPAEVIDTMVLAHFARPDTPNDLYTATGEFARDPMPAFWKARAEYETVESKKRVCLQDSDATWRLYEGVRARLVEEGRWHVVEDNIIPLTSLCMEMRHHGVRVDHEKIAPAIEALGEELAADRAALEATTGVALENSPKQVQGWLYMREDVRRRYHPKTGHLTANEEALAAIADAADTPENVRLGIGLLRGLREKSKLVGFLKAYATSASGVIHAEPHLSTTATGRLSYRNPNLQQVTGSLRHLFLPDAGHLLLMADYRQIEFLVMLYHAQEHALLERGLAGEDFHQMTADFMGLPRKEAKNLNFAGIYGAGEAKMMAMTGLPLETVRRYRELMVKMLPKWEARKVGYLQEIERNGYLETSFKWRRWFTDGGKYNEIIATPIQSDAAFIMRYALVRLREQLPAAAARVWITVHDAVGVSVDPSWIERVAATVKAVLTAPVVQLGDHRFPITMTYGPSWGEQKEWV